MTQPRHGIAAHAIKYVVFAGNFREYRAWCQENKISPREALFVADPSNLGNIRNTPDLRFVRVGTFHLRPDAPIIMEYARSVWPGNPGFTTTS